MSNNRQLAEKIHPIATINRTSAQSIKSSIHYDGCKETRLDSIYGLIPKMVLGERNRHRCFSLSDRSSRAVPPEKVIDEIRSGHGLAMPAKFRRRAKGMGGGDELTGDELMTAQLDWIEDALNACDAAERALKRDEEKETVNRRMDMFVYTHTLQTGTYNGWRNFGGLRLANASPTIELFALKCYEAYKAAVPQPLKPGEWHLPFVDAEDRSIALNDNRYLGRDNSEEFDSDGELAQLINLSAARSAHLSYNDLETGMRMTSERALGVATKLRDFRPLHASPFEHQATPDYLIGEMKYLNEHQHGNLPGWRQARKMIPGEAVAELPAGYSL